MKQTVSILMLVLLADLAFAQGGADASRFAAVVLEDGVPELAPGRKMNSDLAQPKFAVLEEQTDSYTLFFLQGERDDRQTYWTVLRRADSSVTLTSLSMMSSADGGLTDSTDLDLDTASSARAPIEIRLLPASNVVMYRWLGAKSAKAGARSTPLEQPIGRFEEGSFAPDFKVRMLDGERVRFSDLAGKTIIINWWATTCSPCLAEMPGLNELVQEHGSRDDFVFLAIAYDDEADLRAFLLERAFLYRHGLGDENLVSIFGAGFPRNVIIDSAGRVVYDRLGANENQHEEIRSALEAKGLLDK